MKKYNLTLLFYFFLLNSLVSQNLGTDSDGNAVFSFFNLKANRFEFSAKDAISYTQAFKVYKVPWVTEGTGESTIDKYKGFTIKPSIINTGKRFIVNDLNDLNLGFGLEVGYQLTMKDLANLAKTPKGARLYGGSVFFKMDNIDLFDTENNEEGKEYPTTYGVNLNYSYLFKNSKSKDFKSLVSVNATISRGWNDKGLLNYQDIAEATITPTIVALGKFKGRYGVLDNEVDKFRLAVSYPFYKGLFNPVPFVRWSMQSNSTPSYGLGVLLNIMSKTLKKAEYKLPATFGIGIDYSYTGREWQTPKLFLTGSISIGEYKK